MFSFGSFFYRFFPFSLFAHGCMACTKPMALPLNHRWSGSVRLECKALLNFNLTQRIRYVDEPVRLRVYRFAQTEGCFGCSCSLLKRELVEFKVNANSVRPRTRIGLERDGTCTRHAVPFSITKITLNNRCLRHGNVPSRLRQRRPINWGRAGERTKIIITIIIKSFLFSVDRGPSE